MERLTELVPIQIPFYGLVGWMTAAMIGSFLNVYCVVQLYLFAKRAKRDKKTIRELVHEIRALVDAHDKGDVPAFNESIAAMRGKPRPDWAARWAPNWRLRVSPALSAKAKLRLVQNDDDGGGGAAA